MHGSQTIMGRDFDTKSNDLFTYILYQVDISNIKESLQICVLVKASMVNIPYDPILHDLSLTPREMSGAEIVEYWLGKKSFLGFHEIFI